MNKNEDVLEKSDVRKPYESPKLIAELELETRAGSPLGEPDLFFLDGEE